MRTFYLDKDFNRVTKEDVYRYKLNVSEDKKLKSVIRYYTKEIFLPLRKTELEYIKIENILKKTSNADWTYLEVLEKIINNGDVKSDRTGVGTKSIFGTQMRFDLSEGFPLLTTKKMNITNIVSELLWFIAGDTNIKYLLEYNNHIWTDWALERYIKSDEYTGSISKNENLNFVDRNIYKKEREEFEEKILSDEDFNKKYGNLGPVYGKQWRNFNGVDQLKDLIEEIKTNPSSRRLILSAWNPKDIPNMALAPCHVLIQFYVNEGKLSCQLYQRSNDFPLGVPYNIASYAILTHLIAKECNLKVGEFIHTGGDVHIYNNQLEIVKEQFNRLPYEAPELVINNFKSIFEVKPEDIELKNYNSHNFIKIPVSV